MHYPIVIHKEKDTCYGVTVPDLDGCFSSGETMDEAIENSKEAIIFHREMLIDDGEDIPDLMDLDELLSSEDYADGIFIIVEIN